MKRCCFAGHRLECYNINIEKTLYDAIEKVILGGTYEFYNSLLVDFNNRCWQIILQLKKKYPYIKQYKINYNISNSKVLNNNDEILSNVEHLFFKTRFTKMNEWIVDECDVIICHIVNNFNSGAFKMVQYAIRNSKKVIYI